MEKRVISTQVQEEDIKIEKSLRPQTLDDYIGQQKAKENLKIYIEAAKQRGESLDHVLFYGPPGLGKTTLCGIIANEMGVNLKVTSGPAIEKPGEMAAILNNLQEGDVLFVDEIHRLNRQVEEVLYPAMEDFAIDIMLGKESSARSIRLELPHFTLVGATTRAGLLSAPLRDRFGVVQRMEFYTPEELRTIIQHSATILGVEIEPEGLDVYGRPLTPVVYDGKCNYQDKAKTILTAEKKLIEVTGTALFPGDIAPDLPVISGGMVTIFGVERRIVQGTKARNPDGTVNYTGLELI